MKPWEQYQKAKPWEKYGGKAPPPEDGPVDFSASEMVSNIPSSAAKAWKDFYQAARHPVQTAKAVGNLALGGLDSAADAAVDALPNEVVGSINKFNNWLSENGVPLAKLPEGDVKNIDWPNIEHAEQFSGFIKDRYGSMDNFKKTVMSDPVGVVADVAGAVASGGSLLKAAGAGKTGSLMTKAAAQVDPLNAAINTTKYGVGKIIPKGTPANLYESAAKFSTTLPPKERLALSKTALDNRIMPTPKGADKLALKIYDLDSSLTGLIVDATEKGGKIPKRAVFRHLKELRQNKGGVLIESGKDLRAINRIAKEFDLNLKRSKKDFLTPAELQVIKRDIYKKINWDAKNLRGSPIKEDTYKAIARGAKDSLEGLVPGVKSTNQKLGELLELQPHLQRSAGRISNRNAVSINAPLNIGAGGATGGPLGAAIGTGVSIFENPRIKAKTGILLNDLQKSATLQGLLSNPSRLSRARLAALLGGRYALATEND